MFMLVRGMNVHAVIGEHGHAGESYTLSCG